MADISSKSKALDKQQPGASQKTTDCKVKKDSRILKIHLKSLLTLNAKASENSTSYVTFAPVLKEEIASFKPLFSKCTFSVHCNRATFVYFKLLETFREYDDSENVYQLYTNWSLMMQSFTSTSRSETFIENFKHFETIVRHFESADNRWTQLIILSLLRMYTKKVVPQTIRALYSASGREFLKVIEKIVGFPLDQNTSLNVKSNNALITSLNSENSLISSFQPYKIVCHGEEYSLTDFELWMDWHLTKKVVSFTAMCVTTHKNTNICGFTSSKRMRIVSRQNDLFVRSYWALGSSQDNPQVCKIDIQFCLSAQIHSSILESDLRNIFKIDVVEGTSPVDAGLAVADRVEPKTTRTDGQNQSTPFSNIEVDLDAREKPTEVLPDVREKPSEVVPDVHEKRTESTQPVNNQMQRIVEAAAMNSAGSQRIQDVPTSSEMLSLDVGTTTARTSDYFAQTSATHDKSSREGRNEQTLLKRRNDRMDADCSLDVLDMKPHSKRIRAEPLESRIMVKTITSKTTEPMVVEDARQPVRQRKTKKRETVQTSHVPIRMPADNPIKALKNKTAREARHGKIVRKRQAKESNGMDEAKINHPTAKAANESETVVIETHNQPWSPVQAMLRKTFSWNVWHQNWSIRKYFEHDATAMQLDCYDENEAKENIQIKDDDYEDNDLYESVSNPYRCSLDIY